ncbi:hypothetical protein M5689_000959 [Euphorbia peplus]|nr:hypothetical protein M5689_000959 [Euphorbia peplus]
MFYSSVVRFNLVRNPYFVSSYTMAANSNVIGYLPHGYNMLRTISLEKERAAVERQLVPIKTKWVENGLSLVSDRWSAPHNDVEISNEMNKCFKRYFPNADDRRKVLVEYVKFSSMRGEFGEYDSIVDGSQLDPPFWWLIHGTCTPTLKSIAIKLLSQPTSSSCCERNWGTCSFIHSMRRNKITPKCAEDLVFVHNNFSFLSRNTQPYKEGPTKMRDIGGDAIETPDGAGLLEVANLSLDELTFESIVFADERDEIDDDIED